MYNHCTYAKRGWCRLEQWARITQCGVKNMYVCHGQGVEQPLVSFSADVTALRVAADVMSGEFTVAHDRVKLVDVMVQLYHQLQTLPCHISDGGGSDPKNGKGSNLGNKLAQLPRAPVSVAWAPWIALKGSQGRPGARPDRFERMRPKSLHLPGRGMLGWRF